MGHLGLVGWGRSALGAKSCAGGTAAHVWLSGGAGGEDAVGPPLLPCTPGRTSLRGKTRAGAGPLHTSLLHSFPPPPPTWLFSPTSRPARGGLGGVLKIHLQPQNVQQQPSTPLDSGGLSWGTRGHRALRGRLVPVRCQGPGRLVIRNNSYDGGSWGMGGGRLSFPARALFPSFL